MRDITANAGRAAIPAARTRSKNTQRSDCRAPSSKRRHGTSYGPPDSTGRVVPGGIEAETRQTLENIKATVFRQAQFAEFGEFPLHDVVHICRAGEHDIWVHMTPEMRHELKAEDSDAWKHVVGLLLTIVSVGIVLAVLTVWLSS